MKQLICFIVQLKLYENHRYLSDISVFILQSRVVYQQKGERNFHAFYQLLTGANDDILKTMKLTRNAENYHYIRQGGEPKVTDQSDVFLHIAYVQSSFLKHGVIVH